MELEDTKVVSLSHERLIKKINDLTFQIQRTLDYMYTKIHQKDWHGVSDAANDIRDLEAEIKGLRGTTK